jgi:methyl-accepting chemotaxis protein
MKFRNKLLTGYGVVLVFMITIAAIVLINVNNLIENESWVEHTWNVILEGNRIGAAMVDQETGIRGYMVTGEKSYLAPYDAGKINFQTSYTEARKLTSDNPTQVARWDDIKKMADDWENNVVLLYKKMRQDANEGAQAIQTFNQIQGRTIGKEIFDSLRQVLERIDGNFNRNNNLEGKLVTLNILMDMVNQETGQRGFLLTGLEESLDPYNKGKDSLKGNLNNLRDLIAQGKGSGNTLADLAEVTRLADEWVTKAASQEIDARRAVNLAKADMDDIAELVNQGLGKQYMDGIRATLSEAIGAEQILIEERTLNAQNTANLTILITIIATVLAIIASVTIAVFIIIGISKQLGGEPDYIADMAQNIYEGDLDIEFKDTGKKETGIYAAFKKMVIAFRSKARAMEIAAQRDLTVDIEMISEKDGLGKSLNTLKDSLNQVVGDVKSSVDQINIGAGQISETSQSLSQGASEQAASLEEISASITQINSQSKQNAENATEANGLAKKATEDAEHGNKEMGGLSVAMEKINKSSDQIKKIVKVIDDIAFQTNLLALNANVEAARAGKYGKGFAVVADEVRNLAVRSAEAVKETTEMVDESIKNIESGNKAVDATATQLDSIMGGVSKVADFLEEIAVASGEQAEAIGQITQGLEQIDQVTQANTASAEESAAAAEELASQSMQLKSMVATFKLRDMQGTRNAQLRQLEAPRTTTRIERTVNLPKLEVKPVDPSAVIPLDDDDFDRF